jgi:flagellar protein FlbD
VISVTRLDGSQLYLNADLIELVEATPDTIVTLTTHRRLVVRESVDDIVARAIAYQRRVHAGPVHGGRLTPLPSHT